MFNVQHVIPELPQYFDEGDMVTLRTLFLGGGEQDDPTLEFVAPGDDASWWSEYWKIVREAWQSFLRSIGYPPKKSPDDAQPIIMSIERNNERLVFGRPR